GPEDPLVAGLGDKLRAAGLRVFGPGKDGAQIEGSKTFAKTLMRRYAVPTAGSRSFDSFDEAAGYLESQINYPIVVKADGLAAGSTRDSWRRAAGRRSWNSTAASAIRRRRSSSRG